MTRIDRRFLLGGLAAAIAAPALAPAMAPALAQTSRARPRAPLTLFAAASLAGVLGELAATWERETGQPVRTAFAASSALARQLEQGARADLFIAADEAWMDHCERLGLTDRTTRVQLAGNRLVLIAPAGARGQVTLAPGAPLAARLGPRGRLAMGDPEFVPAGRYARQALTTLNLWDGVSGRLVRAENVRAAMAFVARGEAPLGIVYASDAQAEPRVRVLGTFPASSHAPIVYPMAAATGARPGAPALLWWLRGPVARAALLRAGFLPATGV